MLVIIIRLNAALFCVSVCNAVEAVVVQLDLSHSALTRFIISDPPSPPPPYIPRWSEFMNESLRSRGGRSGCDRSSRDLMDTRVGDTNWFLTCSITWHLKSKSTRTIIIISDWKRIIGGRMILGTFPVAVLPKLSHKSMGIKECQPEEGQSWTDGGVGGRWWFGV